VTDIAELRSTYSATARSAVALVLRRSHSRRSSSRLAVLPKGAREAYIRGT